MELPKLSAAGVVKWILIILGGSLAWHGFESVAVPPGARIHMEDPSKATPAGLGWAYIGIGVICLGIAAAIYLWERNKTNAC